MHLSISLVKGTIHLSYGPLAHLSLGEQLRGVVLGHHGLGDLVHDRREHTLVVVYTKNHRRRFPRDNTPPPQGKTREANKRREAKRARDKNAEDEGKGEGGW